MQFLSLHVLHLVPSYSSCRALVIYPVVSHVNSVITGQADRVDDTGRRTTAPPEMQKVHMLDIQ